MPSVPAEQVCIAMIEDWDLEMRTIRAELDNARQVVRNLMSAVRPVRFEELLRANTRLIIIYIALDEAKYKLREITSVLGRTFSYKTFARDQAFHLV